MSYTPEIPRILRGTGRDGKDRLYLYASNIADISMMLFLAGLFQEGIHRQNDRHWNAYFRIIKKHEVKQFLKVFP